MHLYNERAKTEVPRILAHLTRRFVGYKRRYNILITPGETGFDLIRWLLCKPFVSSGSRIMTSERSERINGSSYYRENILSLEDLRTISNYFHRREAEGENLPPDLEEVWKKITVVLEA